MFFRKFNDRVLELTAEEARLLRTGMLYFRNKCLNADKPTEDIDELLVKIMKAKLKRS